MFYLSQDSAFTVETRHWARQADPAAHPQAFWQTNAHTSPARLGLAILAGSQVVFEPRKIELDETGLVNIGAALPTISSDGLEISIRFRPAGGEGDEIRLARKHVESYDDSTPWEEIEIDLDACRGMFGSLIVECAPGPQGDPCADWAALYELVLSPPEKRTLLRARSLREWRAKNEIEHFSSWHSPAEEPRRAGSGVLGWLRQGRDQNEGLSPADAQRFAGELLQREFGRPFPNFVGLLRKRIGDPQSAQKVRMLALCCGTARKESILMSRVDGARVDLTLMDLNAELLERAKTRFQPYCQTSVAPCDVNALDLQGEKFDVILCAAGLHHLIELEHVIDTIRAGLRPGGEFWAVTEYIGCSGARLWPEAYAIANPFFMALPEKYRISAYSGKPDAALPNLDHSVSTFEGIRAPEIERLLESRLEPVYVVKQACWLWRLLDGAYLKNYDPERREDRRVIQSAAALDARHQRVGGRPTNLNGVYRAR